MRISDWSSDVCSSDLDGAHRLDLHHDNVAQSAMGACRNQYLRDRFDRARQFLGHRAEDAALLALLDHGLAVDRGLRTPAEADVRRDIAAALCAAFDRSEEHTSELQSLMRISYAVFCLKQKTT